MNRFLTSSELKRNARTLLYGKLGTVIGAFLVHAVCIMLITTLTDRIGLSTWYQILIYTIVTVVISLIGAVFNLGECFMYLKNASGQEIGVGDVFYGFKGLVQKVFSVRLIPSLIYSVAGIPVILIGNAYSEILLTQIKDPESFMQSYMDAVTTMDPAKIEAIMKVIEPAVPVMTMMVVAFVLRLLVQLIVSALFSQTYYVMLDYPELDVTETIRHSFKIIKGSFGRYIYTTLSFIPWILLAPFSCGISLIWLVVYRDQVMASFYLDLVKNQNG